MFEGVGNFFRDLGEGYKDYAKNTADMMVSGIKDTYNSVKDLMTGERDYSQVVADANEKTDGWYSTVVNSVPIVNGLHNNMLGRDYAKDYMANNDLSWKDMQGYNVNKILGQASGGVSQLASTGARWLKNINNDLGKLYSSE